VAHLERSVKHMKATWHDIERCLNDGTLEDQSQEALEAFSKAEPLPSSNPLYHFRYQQAQDRIRRALDKIYSAEHRAPSTVGVPWHSTWWGGFTLMVLGGLVVAFLAWRFGWI